MSADDTGNGRNLPLSERAKRGLLLSELDLALDEVAALEYPAPGPARKAFAAALSAAIRYGDLAATIQRWQRPGLLVNRDFLRLPPIQQAPVQCVETRIDRGSYRAWRATCPADLLSPLSQIHKWLGATPAIETSPPELVAPAALPEKATREIALVEAENAALWALRKQLKREPNFDEFWDYLVKRDDTGTVADSTNDRLIWIGKDNEDHTTLRSSFRNRLTSAKKRNPFTPS